MCGYTCWRNNGRMLIATSVIFARRLRQWNIWSWDARLPITFGKSWVSYARPLTLARCCSLSTLCRALTTIGMFFLRLVQSSSGRSTTPELLSTSSYQTLLLVMLLLKWLSSGAIEQIMMPWRTSSSPSLRSSRQPLSLYLVRWTSFFLTFFSSV